MNGLNSEKLNRLHRIALLSEDKKDYLIAGMLGVLDHFENFPAYHDVISDVIEEVDRMLEVYDAMEGM